MPKKPQKKTNSKRRSKMFDDIKSNPLFKFGVLVLAVFNEPKFSCIIAITIGSAANNSETPSPCAVRAMKKSTVMPGYRA